MMHESYFLAWLAVFLIFGACWYVVDRRFGVKLYRWWYGMTHEHPLPKDEERGFIYRRKAKSKLSAAMVLSVLQSLLSILSGSVNPMLEVLSVIVEVPLIMIGFYFGPWLDQFWSSKDELLERVDMIESGKSSITNELKGVSQKAAEVIRGSLHSMQNDSGQKQAEDLNTKSSVQVQDPAIRPEEEPEAPDPKELMDRYLKGRN